MEKVGIGMIGSGFARRVQLPAFAACEGVRFVSVASRSRENAEAAAKEFGFEHFTDDWRETAAHPDVDLVCITTPPLLHKEMVLYAVNSGKHILAEKPMAMNTAEAIEMTSAASGSGKLSLIDHELRFQPGRQAAWKMLRDGAIGDIRHATYTFRAPHRGDTTQPWDWWSDAASGGGALGAINSHIIDSFQWFLGTEASSVFCQLQTHVKQRPFGEGMREVTSDDQANMILRFAEGELTKDATGLVEVSMTAQPEYVNLIEFFGSTGSVRIDHLGNLYRTKPGSQEWEMVPTEKTQGISGVTETGFPGSFMAFAPKLIDAIKRGDSAIEHAATFGDGLSVQRVLDAARLSHAEGRRIDLT